MNWRRFLSALLVILSLFLLNCSDQLRSQPYYVKLDTQLAAGAGPDVGYVDSLRAPQYIRVKRLREVPPEKIDKAIYPRLLAYFQQDGKTYALPHDCQPAALMLNQDLLDRVGAQPPKNWDELLVVSEKIAKLGDSSHPIRGIGLTNLLENWLPFLLQAGASLEGDISSWKLNSPEGENALSFYLKLANNAAVEKGTWPYQGHYKLLDRFAAGEIGMMIVGPSHYTYVMNKRKDGQPRVVLAELPAGPKGRATIGVVSAYGMYGYKEPGPAVTNFLTYSTGPEGVRPWLKGMQFLPARTDLREEWLKAHPNERAFMAGLDYLAVIRIPRLSFGQLADLDQKAAGILGGALDRTMTVADTLKGLQQLTEEAAKLQTQ